MPATTHAEIARIIYGKMDEYGGYTTKSGFLESIERVLNKYFIRKTYHRKETVYTSGAYIYRKHIPGEGWIWAVGEFDEDTHREGELVSPNVESETAEGLLNDTDDEQTAL